MGGERYHNFVEGLEDHMREEKLVTLNSDRYEKLVNVRQDNLIKTKHTIYEDDRIKGTRITIIDSISGAIVRETK